MLLIFPYVALSLCYCCVVAPHTYFQDPFLFFLICSFSRSFHKPLSSLNLFLLYSFFFVGRTFFLFFFLFSFSCTRSKKFLFIFIFVSFAAALCWPFMRFPKVDSLSPFLNIFTITFQPFSFFISLFLSLSLLYNLRCI